MKWHKSRICVIKVVRATDEKAEKYKKALDIADGILGVVPDDKGSLTSRADLLESIKTVHEIPACY